jgi:o-succinylbenzoate---CoA ligase
MREYPYSSLLINGREVSINQILQEQERPLTDFEKNTFDFIRSWLKEQQAFTITTSGSTGDPKKITITRESMITSAKLTQQAVGFKEGDNALVCLDTRYIAGQMMLVRCFVANMYIVAVDPTSNPFSKIDELQKVDFTALVPYQVYDLVRSQDAKRLDSINTILIGGAPLDEETKTLLNNYSCQCYATYGMTETISHIALQLLNGNDRSPYFKTLPAIKIHLDDRQCLVIDAPHLPEQVITNDIVHLIDEQTFQWLGRHDNIINTGGVKVIPEKVEEAIAKVLSLNRSSQAFFITAQADAQLGSKMILIVEGSLPLTIEELNESLSSSLTKYELPKELHSLPAFVRTETGKINRRESIKLLLS